MCIKDSSGSANSAVQAALAVPLLEHLNRSPGAPQALVVARPRHVFRRFAADALLDLVVDLADEHEGVGRRLAVLRFLEGVISEGHCNQRHRRRLAERNHPDLLWVEPSYSHQGRLISRSEAEEVGVSRRTPPLVRLDQIRDISRFLSRQPLESSRGLVVLEEPEAMAEAAANALLKTLEEPGHGVLILLSAAPERLLPTIRSRCQLIRLIQLSAEDMQLVLQRLPAEVDQEAVKQGLAQPELVAMAGGYDIKCAKYATFGTRELSKNILRALKGRKACLIANHGQIAFEESLSKAFELAEEVENISLQYITSLKLGKPKILSIKEMKKVLSKAKNYKKDS